MKKFLAIGFLLVSTAATAQNQRPNQGCSVLIGRNWIPMSATSVNGCFKFAEAAATPGERQIAAFGSTSLAYINGQYFLSDNGGASWYNAYPRQAQTVMSSLNKLAEPNDEAAAGKPDNNDGKPVQESPVSSASVPVPVPVPVETAVSEPAQMSQAAQVPVDDTSAQGASPVRQPAAATITPIAAPVAMYICQLKDGNDKWQRYPMASLEQCGMKLADVTVQSGAKSGQAYWNKTYLFYSAKQIYQSSDGEHWLPVQ